MRSGNPRKYKDLLMPELTKELLELYPKVFRLYCNGVGSKIGFWRTLLWHITPNTIWGLDITPASDIHDVGYSYPHIFQSKEQALEYKSARDYELYDNIVILIERDKSWWGKLVKNFRIIRAKTYFELVYFGGDESFMDGKIIINEYTYKA